MANRNLPASLRPTSSPTAGGPQIRANWCKYTMRSLKRAAPALSDPVYRALGEPRRSEIRAAGPLEWLPAQVFFDLCAAIRSGAGVEGARAFWRTSLHDCLEEPFIRPLYKGALFLWGRTPEATIRRTPQAWQLVSRNCGELRAIETGEPASMVLRARKLPNVCRGNLGLLNMWEGGFRGQMDSVDHDGEVETRSEHFEPNGSVDFVIRWRQL